MSVDLVRIVDSIHRDKNIPKEVLFEGIQTALATAAKKHYPDAEEILVTIDPEVDTPARLRAYAEKHGLDPARWSLLHGSPEQVRVLANVLGFRYRPTGDGQWSHTIRIHLLDGAGVVIDHYDGLTRPVEPIAARVHGLLAE